MRSSTRLTCLAVVLILLLAPLAHAQSAPKVASTAVGATPVKNGLPRALGVSRFVISLTRAPSLWCSIWSLRFACTANPATNAILTANSLRCRSTRTDGTASWVAQFARYGERPHAKPPHLPQGYGAWRIVDFKQKSTGRPNSADTLAVRR